MTGHGTGYQPTPAKDLTMVFHAVAEYEPSFTDRVFVDVGAGKGKVLAGWSRLLDKHGLSQAVTGVELDPALAAHDSRIVVADAITFPYSTLSDRLLMWVFNPFTGDGFTRLIDGLDGLDALVVVNNPDDAMVLVQSGWDVPVVLFREGQRNSWFVARRSER